MINQLHINHNIVHLWRIFLPPFFSTETILKKILSPDEISRADRFVFPEHRQRFITTRALLRKTLAFYTSLSAKDIVFGYAEHGKPFLANNPLKLEFNISHSENIAMFAITVGNEIGIDIQQVALHYDENIAKKFFSPQEYSALIALPHKDQNIAFYRLWSKKEAIIKTQGERLLTFIRDFSVSTQAISEKITISGRNQIYYLNPIEVDPKFQAAFATVKPTTEIQSWQWTLDGPELI